MWLATDDAGSEGRTSVPASSTCTVTSTVGGAAIGLKYRHQQQTHNFGI